MISTVAVTHMEYFNRIFQYWPQYRVIYCRQCRFCPVPSQIAGHLDLQYVNVPKQIRARIVEEVQKILDVA